MQNKHRYGEFVREFHTPVINEKKKNERIDNIVSPKSFMGRGHADPTFFLLDNPNGLPKSLEIGLD